MKNKALLLTYIIAITSLFVFNSGCNGGGTSQSDFGSIAAPPPAPSVLPGTSNGLLDDAQNFYVGVETTSELISHVRSITGFNTSCGISKDSTANEDVTCLVDVPEAELHNKNLELKFNVPPGMCRYLQRDIYWFFDREVGQGPKTISATVAKTIDIDGNLLSAAYSCVIDGIAGDCTNNAVSNPEINATLKPDSQIFKCVYDHSEANLPNCCFGNYALTVTTTTTGPGINLSETTTSEASWGGDYSKCIGGPGRTNWTMFAESDQFKGLPVSLITYAPYGITDKQTVTSALDLRISENIHTSNYYGATVNHTHTGYKDLITTSNLPYYITPIDDRSGTKFDSRGTYLISAHDSYEFRCIDEADEVKHRIRVYVRDWDTYPDYLAYISSQGGIAVPDRGADPEPGTNCNSVAVNESCNDHYDADDFLLLYLLGSYNTGDVTTRWKNFPGLGYK